MDYKEQNGYLIPQMGIEPEEQVILGKYALLRREYLKNHRKTLYNQLLLSGQLHQHLTEIEQTAEKRKDEIMNRLTELLPPPPRAKQMEWVRHMYSLEQTAEETIMSELIYCN